MHSPVQFMHQGIFLKAMGFSPLQMSRGTKYTHLAHVEIGVLGYGLMLF